jgi:hypothetical protein
VITFLVERPSSEALMKSLNDLNQICLKRRIRVRFATCINTNEVTEYMDKEGGHKDERNEHKDEEDEVARQG